MSRKILIADDEPAIVAAVELLLQRTQELVARAGGLLGVGAA